MCYISNIIKQLEIMTTAQENKLNKMNGVIDTIQMKTGELRIIKKFGTKGLVHAFYMGVRGGTTFQEAEVYSEYDKELKETFGFKFYNKL